MSATLPDQRVPVPGFPTAVKYGAAQNNRWLGTVRRVAVKTTGRDLFPTDEQIQTFAEDMFRILSLIHI